MLLLFCFVLDPDIGICIHSYSTLSCSEVCDGNRGIYVDRETSMGHFLPYFMKEGNEEKEQEF